MFFLFPETFKITQKIIAFLSNFRASHRRTIKSVRVFVLSHSIHGEPKESMLHDAPSHSVIPRGWAMSLMLTWGACQKYGFLGRPQRQGFNTPGIEPENMYFKAPWQFCCIDRFGNHPLKHTSFLSLPYSVQRVSRQALPHPQEW